ncbi:hypothetical protein BRE01_62520 [Brevibacillus reuszeri]|uniref:Uncharacterized protein n=1 Tax=Brevibacillus reuszeri TaxID=54915 RepID=A0ABQ0TXK4_9BACL|nr:hypothetical protein BRE01_62520 [Brevibacillus reuszeri]
MSQVDTRDLSKADLESIINAMLNLVPCDTFDFGVNTINILKSYNLITQELYDEMQNLY